MFHSSGVQNIILSRLYATKYNISDEHSVLWTLIACLYVAHLIIVGKAPSWIWSCCWLFSLLLLHITNPDNNILASTYSTECINSVVNIPFLLFILKLFQHKYIISGRHELTWRWIGWRLDILQLAITFTFCMAVFSLIAGETRHIYHLQRNQCVITSPDCKVYYIYLVGAIDNQKIKLLKQLTA